MGVSVQEAAIEQLDEVRVEQRRAQLPHVLRLALRQFLAVNPLCRQHAPRRRLWERLHTPAIQTIHTRPHKTAFRRTWNASQAQALQSSRQRAGLDSSSIVCTAHR